MSARLSYGCAAAIRPDTFRVCYVDFVPMDITNRITGHVAISAQGIHVAEAQLPQGHHHLVMMIGDSQGKIGRSNSSSSVASRCMGNARTCPTRL